MKIKNQAVKNWIGVLFITLGSSNVYNVLRMIVKLSLVIYTKYAMSVLLLVMIPAILFWAGLIVVGFKMMTIGATGNRNG